MSIKNGLDLLLINVGGAKRRVYQDLSCDYSAIEPPFWAALTADFIRRKGYSVGILDANAENLTHEETSGKVEDINPKLINIVVYGQHPYASTHLMHAVDGLCREIKKRKPETKIILTGLHPSALPERTLKEDVCDYVCQGEGFYTLLGLIQEHEKKKIPGLWWREKGEIRHTERARNIENLTEELSGVAWDLLPMDKYRAHNWQCFDNFGSRRLYASITTSLGCPFNCKFCSINTTYGKRGIRYWSPDWVLKQLENLSEKYNVKNIRIIDEMFVMNPQHYAPIVNGLIEQSRDLNIWSYIRVDTAKEEYLEKLKKAGFNWLCFGFETGSQKVRESVSKGNFSRDDMVAVRNKVKKAGINIIGNYLFGLPEDNLDSMQETLDLAIELNCEFANMWSGMAYPGSELYKIALEKEWKMPDSWLGYAQQSYECQPLPTNYVSAEEVLRFRDYAFNTYHTNPGYLAMIEKKFGVGIREHIEGMTKTKLKRRLLGDIL